jgi:uncharacterized RDD family membrane protein YckC
MKTPFPFLRAALSLAALSACSITLLAADPAKPQDAATPTPTTEAPLHEIGASTASSTASAPAAATPTPTSEPAPYRHHDRDDEGRDRVAVTGAVYVGADETIPGNAVAIMGPVTIDGTVEGNAVSVMGSNTINGTVEGNVVVVLGRLTLGPNSKIEGNAVTVGGKVDRAPGSIVNGGIIEQGHGLDFSDNSGAMSWWHNGLRMGRPVAFGPNLSFLWLLNICLIGLYLLLSVAFPNGIRKCGDTLVNRPGLTFMTGILAILALPVVFILLLVTVVGIPVAVIVLPLSILAALLFGRAAINSLVGRSILGKDQHPALTVLVGSLVMLALYLVPLVGLMLFAFVAFLGFSCALATLFTSTRATLPPPPPPVVVAGAPVAAPAAATVPPVIAVPLAAAAPESAPAPQEAAPVPPPPQAPAPVLVSPAAAESVAHVSEAALPRAGFWLRMVALLIDFLLIGLLTQMRSPHVVLILLAAYGAVLWKVKGATIGGIIFGLKVVRSDGKPMEWTTALVRALACFFSLLVAGLGFFWIAFDKEKQGWHDKIAGTVVVRLPKGVSLI